jgi:hypothetical protein
MVECVDSPADRTSDEEAGRDRRGRCRGRDGENLEVVSHPEHDPARQEHGDQR